MIRKTTHAMKALRLFCAMVFLSLGFAHQTPAAIAASTQSSVYSLPDGTYADLCIADKGQAHDRKADCEACRLAGTALLPEPGSAWLIRDFAIYRAAFRPHTLQHMNIVLDQPRSRGPPLSA